MLEDQNTNTKWHIYEDNPSYIASYHSLGTTILKCQTNTNARYCQVSDYRILLVIYTHCMQYAVMGMVISNPSLFHYFLCKYHVLSMPTFPRT